MHKQQIELLFLPKTNHCSENMIPNLQPLKQTWVWERKEEISELIADRGQKY